MSSPKFAVDRAVQTKSGIDMRNISNDVIQTFQALEQQVAIMRSGAAGQAADSAAVSIGAMSQDGKVQANNLGMQGDAWVVAAKNQTAVDEATEQSLKRGIPTAPAGRGLGINR
jgi:hypothetical protein